MCSALITASFLIGFPLLAAEPPPAVSLTDCDARPNAYMRVECRVILDPDFDPKWRRMTPSEMQDAVDADPCVGFSSPAAEKKCRENLPKRKNP